mgnify:CR=1 FL=1
MKFLSFLIATVLVLSFSVTAFADEILEPTLPDPEPEVKVQEEEHPATTNNEYLDMVLNGMQNQISDLNEKVEVIEDDIDSLSESASVSDSPTEDVTSNEVEEFNPDTDMPVSIELMSVAPIRPSDTSGLKAVLLSVIGDYDPVIVEYEYQNNNNYSSYLREVLPDYPWCASFLMLALFVYCIFRLGGALIG